MCGAFAKAKYHCDIDSSCLSLMQYRDGHYHCDTNHHSNTHWATCRSRSGTPGTSSSYDLHNCLWLKPGGTTCSSGQYLQGGSSCITCPTGRYQSNSAFSGSSCTSCEAGKYESSSRTSCQLCAAGKYSTATGARTSSTCTLCGAGKFSASSGASSSSSCTTCAAGQYDSSTRASCNSCPSGRTSSAGSDSSSDCHSPPPPPPPGESDEDIARQQAFLQSIPAPVHRWQSASTSTHGSLHACDMALFGTGCSTDFHITQQDPTTVCDDTCVQNMLACANDDAVLISQSAHNVVFLRAMRDRCGFLAPCDMDEFVAACNGNTQWSALINTDAICTNACGVQMMRCADSDHQPFVDIRNGCGYGDPPPSPPSTPGYLPTGLTSACSTADLQAMVSLDFHMLIYYAVIIATLV